MLLLQCILPYKMGMHREIHTYREINNEVRRVEGFVVKTCWIADAKEQLGMPMRRAPNRQGEIRLNPCPPNKRAAIVAAMKRLEML